VERIRQVEARFPGYQGLQLQPPIPGLQEDWVSLLRFDTADHLNAWLESDARRSALEEVEPFIDRREQQIATSFSGWFTFGDVPDEAPPNWKQSKIMLLMLYPIVMLELLFLNPLLNSLGMAEATFIGNLLSGNYEGDVSFTELRTSGDFGLGTFDALDGEMVALDGEFYQVKADGIAYEVDEQLKTPFAVVTFFEPDLHRTLTGPVGYEDLCDCLDRIVGDMDECHAVRVDGLFHYVKTRSVPRQRKPYPPLVEVVKHQPIFELRDVRGSLVGFRFPNYAQGLNVPGYHLHFITENRRGGRHLLECHIAHGELRVDHEVDLRLELPTGIDAVEPDVSAAKKDVLDRIERA
jgi:acetolactate decarboxylase